MISSLILNFKFWIELKFIFIVIPTWPDYTFYLSPWKVKTKGRIISAWLMTFTHNKCMINDFHTIISVHLIVLLDYNFNILINSVSCLSPQNPQLSYIRISLFNILLILYCINLNTHQNLLVQNQKIYYRIIWYKQLIMILNAPFHCKNIQSTLEVNLIKNFFNR